MLTGASIVCFAHDWGGDPTSKTHIMRILAEKNRVLWVNSIGMRRPAASVRDLRRLWTKLRRGLAGCVRIHDNLHVWSPLVLPLPGVRGADAVNTLILTASLRRLARGLAMERPLLWSFLPNVNRLVGRLDERLVIYHCVDEYTAFSGVPRAALETMERDLVTKADLVFASSEELARDRRRYNPRTFFVSHGVDAHHFGRARHGKTSIPADLAGVRRPIVGFFGLLADWVDLDLIRTVAVARPEWSVVLIGQATTSVDALTGLPNVHLLGQRPYEMLPAYCRAFDVGIVPFRMNELTRRANPLKLREYLAAGLPVVASGLPEVRKYDGLVRIADATTFVEQIERALHERDDISAERRQAAMAAESWEARVEELSSFIAAVGGEG